MIASGATGRLKHFVEAIIETVFKVASLFILTGSGPVRVSLAGRELLPLICPIQITFRALHIHISFNFYI
jgi:hypothetical protein